MRMSFLLVPLAFVVGSCAGNSDARKIGEAQFCLDKASTPGEVSNCLAIIEGISGTAAENLRCTGGFLKEGFLEPSRIVSAFNAISGGTSSSNNMNLMGYLSFTSGGNINTDIVNVAKTFDHCVASGAAGATLLASFSYIGMGLYRFGNANSVAGCASSPGLSNPFRYDIA
ncbi:MAG: hypothetical protein N2578_03050, partial [Bdellovibrionaceae bacterium]|nr:hypothetical protein [Pseudobdellovibrionaceae bacterium]